jgi:GAF domain-containing protein
MEHSKAPDKRWWDEQTLQDVIKSGQPVLSYDLAHRGNGKQNSQSRTYALSRLTVPMRRGGKVIGAINLESSQPDAFTQEDLKFVTNIADQVVIVLEGAALEERAESEHERLSKIDDGGSQ